MSTLSAIYGTTIRGDDWRARAACVGEDPELWFDGDIERGLYICSECPVQRECLDVAEEHEDRFGIWGGLTPQDRDQGHGTLAKYRAGCKCRRCRGAKNAHQRQWRDTMVEKLRAGRPGAVQDPA